MMAPGADAVYPDHLAGHIDDLELQPAAIILEGGPVGPELLVEHPLHLLGSDASGGLQLPHRDHDRGWLTIR